ncbi:MAG: hypothetical protein ACREFE_09195 [Limisphaerales bacterium]
MATRFSAQALTPCCEINALAKPPEITASIAIAAREITTVKFWTPL